MWSVDSTRCPVSEASEAMKAVSLSRISPIMMMSGSPRTRERSMEAKVSPISGRIWDLEDPGDHSLDRVLDRVDLHLRPVQFLETGVEGGGLACPGRSCDEHLSVGAPERLAEQIQLGAFHAQVLQAEGLHPDVEQPDGHVLAEHGGQGGDTQVDGVIVQAERGPAVLGQALLGDVHVPDDLDARHDTVLDVLGDVGKVVEHPVDPHTHRRAILVGLDVDI